MTVLVFGSTGQVGRELARAGNLLLLGRDQANLMRPETCAEKILATRPDCVINAAAYTAVDQAEDAPDEAHLVNAVAPGEMAKTCAKIGIPFLHISTDYVFDGSGDNEWREHDATGPISIYGRTKLAGETAIAQSGADFAILRTSWVYSAHGNNFVRTMLDLSRRHTSLNVVADQIGGPTAASDIAAAILHMGNQFLRGQGVQGIYHFAGAPNVSWADFACEIFQQAGRDIEVNNITAAEYPTKAARPANSRMDCSKILADYGISRPDWRKSLSRVLAELG